MHYQYTCTHPHECMHAKRCTYTHACTPHMHATYEQHTLKQTSVNTEWNSISRINLDKTLLNFIPANMRKHFANVWEMYNQIGFFSWSCLWNNWWLIWWKVFGCNSSFPQVNLYGYIFLYYFWYVMVCCNSCLPLYDILSCLSPYAVCLCMELVRLYPVTDFLMLCSPSLSSAVVISLQFQSLQVQCLMLSIQPIFLLSLQFFMIFAFHALGKASTNSLYQTTLC